MTREEIFEATIDRYLGPVKQFWKDPSVTEIMINGPDEIYVEAEGQLRRTEATFEDADWLMSLATNLAQYTNKRISDGTARFDSRLPDGSRVHVVMPRISRKGLCISIRKFAKNAFSLEGMVKFGTLTDETKEYLETLIALERNIIVSGGTGSGKTSFLNAISEKIPKTERIIVIEDTSELKLQQPHVLRFEAATPDRYGKGAVSIRDLFHSALRMRPDRIVIGECRGGEALDLIQALTSGHGGSMSTLHATSASDALNRMETMALMSGVNIPASALRSQIASAIHVVVQLDRLADGNRIITEVGEVAPLSSQGYYQLTTIYLRESFGLEWTGNHSRFGEMLKTKDLAHGISLTQRVFDTGEKAKL